MVLPTEIDFLTLSPDLFEELCFDLLDELGFKQLVWRQGGPDDGRDIQGIKPVDAGLTDPFEEIWFFECKRHKNGVPPAELNSKIAWADADKPHHYVFFISSYLTPRARDWITKIQTDKRYRIHVVEGKRLQELVARSRKLTSRYFATSADRLMQEAHRAWLHHNLIPEPQLLRTLADTMYLDDYSTSQLAFLWASLKIRLREVQANMDDSFSESYDIVFSMLKQRSNTDTTILDASVQWSLINEVEGESHADLVYTKVYAAELASLVERCEHISLYCLVRDGEGEGLEVLVDQDSSLTCRIRHIATGARTALHEAKKILYGE